MYFYARGALGPNKVLVGLDNVICVTCNPYYLHVAFPANENFCEKMRKYFVPISQNFAFFLENELSKKVQNFTNIVFAKFSHFPTQFQMTLNAKRFISNLF